MDYFENVKISDLLVGDVIDLEGDRYADPDRDNVSLQHGYAEVTEVRHETEDCTSLVVLASGGEHWIGFPPKHRVYRKASHLEHHPVRIPAPMEAVEATLAGEHSPWLWIVFPDGDKVLGVYPQADTYEEAWYGNPPDTSLTEVISLDPYPGYEGRH